MALVTFLPGTVRPMASKPTRRATSSTRSISRARSMRSGGTTHSMTSPLRLGSSPREERIAATRSGGTWMGIGGNGRTAVITNVRDPGATTASVTPSSTSSKGGSFSASSRSSSEWACSMCCTSAATPWWPWLPANLASRSASASIMRTPASLQRSMNCRMRASRREASKYTSMMDCGATLRRTPTAWKPKSTLGEDIIRLSFFVQLARLDGQTAFATAGQGAVMGDQHQGRAQLAVEAEHQIHHGLARGVV